MENPVILLKQIRIFHQGWVYFGFCILEHASFNEAGPIPGFYLGGAMVTMLGHCVSNNRFTPLTKVGGLLRVTGETLNLLVVRWEPVGQPGIFLLGALALM